MKADGSQLGREKREGGIRVLRWGCAFPFLGIVVLSVLGAFCLMSNNMSASEARTACAIRLGGLEADDRLVQFRTDHWGDGSSEFELQLTPATYARVHAEVLAKPRRDRQVEPRVASPDRVGEATVEAYHFVDASYVFVPSTRTLFLLDGYP